MISFRPLFAALIITAAAPAVAQSDVSIKTNDLDLSSEAGRATLEKRIAVAERRVCNGQLATESRIQTSIIQRECKAEFRRQVEAQLPTTR
ncbi:MAG: UrcA family protein [Novosphingobium sp.]|jgi:UrcA family protein|nr:UrcA family protein [Novosphingobium sp.]